MTCRPLALAVATLLLAGATACASGGDLRTLQVADVSSGWYDNGLRSGQTHLVPSITFRLKNGGPEPIANVQLLVSFWRDGADGESESLQVSGIGSTPLALDATTDPILVRPPHGYTLDGARSDFFGHSLFKDMTARIFAKQAGKIVPLGQFKIDRIIIPNLKVARTP